jgi:alkylhydroperoxidase family enzyme
MVGLSDDDLAALDHDWNHFDARTQKALALARKMTQSPQDMNDADIENLHPEFDDAQIIELVYTIARFNSTNRWTDSMGIPQDQVMRGEAIHFDTPTAEKWSKLPSLASPNVNAKRELMSASEVEGAVAKAESRKPRVKLPSDDEARKILEIATTEPINDWHRAVAALKAAHPKMIANHFIMIRHGELSPQLKLQLMRRSAMWNHGWLSLAIAEHELKQTEPNSSVSKEAEAAALDFADKLTTKPFAISDLDIKALQKHFTDRQVAQIIHVVATANGLDRFCETLGLSSALAED